MEVLTKVLLEKGGVWGVASVVALLIAAMIAHSRGWFGMGSRQPGSESSINAIESRVSLIEQDLKTRPTAEDFKRVEIKIGRLDERQKAMESKIDKVGEGVGRIEDFLFQLAKGRKE